MGRIVVFENVSLDGVTQDPTGEEGYNAADWRTGLSAAAKDEWKQRLLKDTLGVQALLLGRRSYQFFAARYPYRTGIMADLANSLPKYVLSSTLTELPWNNTVLVSGDATTEVAKLKDSIDGTILIWASSQLVHELVEHDLVDEFRLALYPLVIGRGTRLFSETTNTKHWHLAAADTLQDLTYLTYQRI
jgi:dihydrofolate reductase